MENETFLDKVWRILCCSTTIQEQNDLELERQAKNADLEEFKEWNEQYVSCCGQIHIKTLARAIIIIKAFFFGFLLIGSWIRSDISDLVKVGILLAFGLVLTSIAVLLIGLQALRFHLLIPYFFTSFILIVVGVVRLFIDFLDSANTRDTTETHRVSSYLIQISLILFEVYVLMLIWRVFQYIVDARMSKEIEESLLAKSTMYDDEYLHIV